MSEVASSGAHVMSLKSFVSARGEVPSLDGLRALSILTVMMSHLGLAWIPGGHGVFLFFIISGFLITRLFFLEKISSGKISLHNFYKRRFFRLYPVIAVYCIIVPAVYFYRDGRINLIEPISALFYFSNYLVAARDLSEVAYQMPFKIFWSLSVEEHFYIIFPLMVVALKSPLRIFVFAVGTCVAVLALRIGAAYAHPELVGTHYLYMRTEFRIDAVAFGVSLASACEIPAGWKFLSRLIEPSGFVAAAFVASVSILISNDYFANVVRYAVLGPCLALLIAAIVFSDKYRIIQIALNLRPIVWIGRLSYSLYVWHLPCMIVATWAIGGNGGFIIAWPLSFSIAALSYYFVEQPAMRFGKRFGGQARQALGR